MLPFKEPELRAQPARMKIGYFKAVALIPTVSAQERAVEIAKSALEQCGHELVEIQLPQIDQLAMLAPKLVYSGKLSYLHEMVGDEPVIDSYRASLLLVNLPKWLLKVIKFALYCFHQRRLAQLVENLTGSDAGEYARNIARL